MLERSNPLLAMTTAISERRTTQKAIFSPHLHPQRIWWRSGSPAPESGLTFSSDNYLPLVWRFYSRYRSVVDQICKDGTQISISAEGEPVLKRIAAAPPPSGAAELEAEILQRLGLSRKTIPNNKRSGLSIWI